MRRALKASVVPFPVLPFAVAIGGMFLAGFILAATPVFAGILGLVVGAGGTLIAPRGRSVEFQPADMTDDEKQSLLSSVLLLSLAFAPAFFAAFGWFAPLIVPWGLIPPFSFFIYGAATFVGFGSALFFLSRKAS